jgi:cystathionine beta-lyase/cystathionine gamma-synthase
MSDDSTNANTVNADKNLAPDPTAHPAQNPAPNPAPDPAPQPEQNPPLRLESRLVHPPGDNDEVFGDVVVPVHLTTTYRQEAFASPPRYDYSRGGNPTRQVVEDQIAALEDGGFGLAFSSGMAAITAALALLDPGAEVLIPRNIYGGSFRVLERYFKRFGLGYRFVDLTDVAALDAQFGPAAAVLFESPTNPLLSVVDIAAVAEVAHAHGALVMVDNTFLTPLLQRPLELGADIVLHSATKFLGGHSDVLAGLIAVRDRTLYHRLHFIHYTTGAVLSPFDSYLLARGIKTLAVRLERQCASAAAIAAWLTGQPQVSRVYYPGLPSDPGHAVQSRQATAHGSLLSFELAEEGAKGERDANGGQGGEPGAQGEQSGPDAPGGQGTQDAQSAPATPGAQDAQYAGPERFAQSLRLITLAESLGAVESLICHPATMTHASIPADLRAEMGIGPRLLRLSVGIEHVDDLIADLAQAFEQAQGSGH